MIAGRYFISTGLRRSGLAVWHVLAAVHRRWRFGLRKVHQKPGYWRFYSGPVEIEWSRYVQPNTERKGGE